MEGRIKTCQVTWPLEHGFNGGERCYNEATHWACATDTSQALFKVCAQHAQSVRDILYSDDRLMPSRRLKGEPLWVCQEIK